jgi:hypothetical protein
MLLYLAMLQVKEHTPTSYFFAIIILYSHFSLLKRLGVRHKP